MPTMNTASDAETDSPAIHTAIATTLVTRPTAR
jgi:hypothetical protein